MIATKELSGYLDEYLEEKQEIKNLTSETIKKQTFNINQFISYLENEGIEIVFDDVVDSKITDLDIETTLVIYTPAIKTLGILDYFNQNKFDVLKRAKVLGLITENTECIAVAGTHGKTTTSTLVAHLAKEANLPFSCFLGGISENDFICAAKIDALAGNQFAPMSH